jgi:predicted  nucleic acid-binding Zn-ribbon protein
MSTKQQIREWQNELRAARMEFVAAENKLAQARQRLNRAEAALSAARERAEPKEEP